MFIKMFLLLSSLVSALKIRFSLVITSILFLFVYKANSQTNYELPKIISPSPQSQALTRYGDYPMADFAGLTNIAIPIHTVTGRKLSLPITMSFHASGRLAHEENGILGMRWTLNCGGLITRTVKGYPDEWNLLTPYVVAPSMTPSFDVLYAATQSGRVDNIHLLKPYYDTEFDIFSYSFPNGKTGHFILKNQNGSKVPMVIPFDPLKIEIVKDPSYNGFIQSICVTDDDGTKYYFGKTNSSVLNSIEQSEEIFPEDRPAVYTPTAWYLTKIISSDGTDEISLSYNIRYTNSVNATQSAHVYDELRNDDSRFYESQFSTDPYQEYLRSFLINYFFEQDYQIILNGSNKEVPTLSTINFSGGSVSINYVKDPNLGQNNDLVSEIIFNRESVPFKKVKLNTSKHAIESDIYYLDNLSFYGEKQTQFTEQYSFSYYETAYSTPLLASEAKKDWWGNYCTNGGLVNLLPIRNIRIVPITNTIPIYRDIAFQSTNRESNEESKKLGMLKEITYPTGGKTEFIYESNKYKKDYYSENGPGLRIKEIISKPTNGQDIHKIYKYGLNEDGNGYINESLRPGSTMRDELTVAQGVTFHLWNFYVPPSPPGSENTTAYRTRDFFSDPYIRFDFPGSPIKYNEVSEYYLENTDLKQKTLSQYCWEDNEEIKDFTVTDHEGQIQHVRKYSNPQNAWKTPTLSSKLYYKYSDRNFDPVKKETYDYAWGASDEAWDMPTYLHSNIIYLRRFGDGRIDYASKYTAAQQIDTYICSVYGYGFRKYTTGTQLLLNKSVEEITPTVSIKTDSHYEYDENNLLINVNTKNSKNETIRTEYKYPNNFKEQQPYNEMINNKHIISPVIEQSTYKVTENSTSFLSSQKTNYNFWSGTSWSTSPTNIIVPQSVVTRTLNQPSNDVRAQFNQYDASGNLLEVQKANDVKEAYIWGYNYQYPVAKIVGKSYDEVISQVTLDNNIVKGSNVTDEAMRQELSRLRSLTGVLLITTYTYKPLVGMTSQTDPNGRTIYYEYDPFNRLKLIRDQDGNIIKTFDYHYKQQ